MPPIDPTLLPSDDTADVPVPLRTAADEIVPILPTDTLGSGQPTAAVRPLTIPGYTDLRVIGRGAAGIVYRATQTKLNRRVAIKVLHAQAFASPDDLARFRTEALAIARIQHPNVIQVYDLDEDGAIPFIAVEYMDGGTLEAKLTSTPMPIPDALRLVYQIARGVGAAHDRGVIHRDLKPANILLTTDGTPKVADFGLAKQLGAETLTMTGTVMGTPAYMAPEQALGQSRQLTPRTDVYALGVILYQCLTGVVPHRGDTVLQTLERVRAEVPLPVRVHRADVPPELEDVVSRCLRKNPAERYATAGALADDLARLAAARSRGAARPTAARSRGPSAGVFVGVAAVALLALIGWIWAKNAGWLSPRPTPKDAPAGVSPATPTITP